MITEEEVCQVYRRYFPEPIWKVWVGDPDVHHHFRYVAVKTVVLIDGGSYGQTLSLVGLTTLDSVERFAKQYSDLLRSGGVTWEVP